MAKRVAASPLELLYAIQPSSSPSTARPTASGKHLVVNLGFGGNELWDLETKKEVLVYQKGTGVTCWMAVPTPDETGVLSAFGDFSIKLFKFAGGLAWETDDERRIVTSISIADDSVTAATGDHKVVRFWDLASGTEKSRFAPKRSGTGKVAISPNGRFAACGASDKFIHLLDVRSGGEVAAMSGHTKPITCVAFTPDSKRIVSSAGDGTVRVWDVLKRAEVACIEASRRPIGAIAVSPNGNTILAAGNDRYVRVIDIHAGVVTHQSEEMKAIVEDVAVTGDGAKGFSCSHPSIQVWRMP